MTITRTTRNFKWGTTYHGRFFIEDRRTGFSVHFDAVKVDSFMGYGDGVQLRRHVSQPGYKSGFLPKEDLPAPLLDDLKHIESDGKLPPTDSISQEVSHEGP